MTQLSKQQQYFDQLTRPWRDRLFNTALQKTNTSARAEDWVQETLLRAWRDFKHLSDQIAVYAWLLKILDHVIADDTRREVRRSQLAPVVSTEDVNILEHSSYKPGPFEQILQQQEDEQLINAIKTLPDNYRSIILLRDVEGLSYREISTILNIAQGTVMSRLSRGRRLLSTVLIKTDSSIAQLSNKNTGDSQ